jgi:hypothetical protein
MDTGKECVPKDGNIFRNNGKNFRFVPGPLLATAMQSHYYMNPVRDLNQLSHLAHTYWPVHRKALAELYSYHVAELTGTGFHEFRKLLA